MKNIISILILFVAVGCDKEGNFIFSGKRTLEEIKLDNEAMEREAENRRLEHEIVLASKKLKLEKDVVGSYENYTRKFVFLENSKFEFYLLNPRTNPLLPKCRKLYEGTWIIEKKEIHAIYATPSAPRFIYKLEPNGDLTEIARIKDSKREAVPKEKQVTFKRLKE